MQVESSRRNSKRPGSSFHISGSSKSRSSPSELPTQSCPSPPVLTRHHSGSVQASSSSLKQSSSTSKKTNAKSHRKEYLAISNNEPGSESGSEKEEVSITNNLSEIFHNKRDKKVSKSGKLSENYLARSEGNPGNSPSLGSAVSRSSWKVLSWPSPPSCDLDNCDKTGDSSGSMPTLQDFSGNDNKRLMVNY